MFLTVSTNFFLSFFFIMSRHGKLFPVTGVLILVIVTGASVLPEIENFALFDDIDENAFADALKNPSEDAYLSTVRF